MVVMIDPKTGTLVERISAAAVTLILVNTSPVHGRDVVVQTGGYGEHRCTSVEQGGRSPRWMTPIFGSTWSRVAGGVWSCR